MLPARVRVMQHDRYQIELPTADDATLCELALEERNNWFSWSVSVRGGAGQPIALHFPFLQYLTVGEGSRVIDLFSGESAASIPLLRYRNFQAPWVITDDTRSLVVLHEGDLVAKAYTPTPIAGGTGLPVSPGRESARGYSPANLSSAPGLFVAPGREPATVYRGAIAQIEGGWRSAFALIRARLRAQLDLGEYQRSDLRWMDEQLVHHFTFLYGREILDLERGVFDIARFLDEGERDFGGYDGFLIWAGYPRVGIDERTQWDFFDDLPGGRAGLRDMAAQARRCGARLFVPYLPWDRSHELHGRAGASDEEELARLIADVDADGVFLDTLGMITPEFRQAIDCRKPGVAFCSEIRTQGKALELVTSCWEQSYTRDGSQGNWSAAPEHMPMVDLWRFVLPEHRLFVINRHAMAEDRVRIIQRGFFNGMGWVVWMDIFGLTLPYMPAEAALLKKCRTIFRENLGALNGKTPTPLVETLIPGLYANEFAGDSQRMWTLYNGTEGDIIGEVMPYRPRPHHHLVDVWHETAAGISPRGYMSAAIESHALGCVVEYPVLIELNTDQSAYRVSAAHGDKLSIRTGHSETAQSPAEASDWTPLPQQQGPLHIRLMHGRQTLDQIYLPGRG